MVEIISLSRSKEKGVNRIEATFKVNGELVPLRLSEQDRANDYVKINEILNGPSVDYEAITSQLYKIMAPEALVRESINSSFYLSQNLSIEDGRILFAGEVLEETLSNHMFTLLNEDNVPKDEKLWSSYVKFLDNLHQNANEDIRKQLFRWMDYENKAGNSFAITDDGCFVGYKGCIGTILEPKSKFEGTAIVDGVEHTGQIPNKVGSVIQMPRSAVQYDPSVGCSFGLHVGTRDYAVGWAPVLILVKVNPRDVVSVPYECQSQKIRVCEYTVLKVTDVNDEHRMFYETETEIVNELEDLLGFDVLVEYENYGNVDRITGVLYEVFSDENEESISVRTKNGEILTINYDSLILCEEINRNDSLAQDEVLDLIENESTIKIVRDDGKEYKGLVVGLYVAPGKDPGVILKDIDSNEYSHIKLYRVEDWEEIESEIDCECSVDKELKLTEEEVLELIENKSTIKIERDDGEEYEGLVVGLYVAPGKDPGVILKDISLNKHSHIKLYRVVDWEEIQRNIKLTIGDKLAIEYRNPLKLKNEKVTGLVLAVNVIQNTLIIVDEEKGIKEIDISTILFAKKL